MNDRRTIKGRSSGDAVETERSQQNARLRRGSRFALATARSALAIKQTLAFGSLSNKCSPIKKIYQITKTLYQSTKNMYQSTKIMYQKVFQSTKNIYQSTKNYVPTYQNYVPKYQNYVPIFLRTFKYSPFPLSDYP